MKRVFWAALALAGMIAPALADMPDCLSGICLRQVYSPEFFKKEGFLAKPNACEETTEYTKETKGVYMRVVVYNYAVKGDDANAVHYIRRDLEFGKELALVSILSQAFLDKYGETDRKKIITEEPYANAKFIYGEEGPDGKTKSAAVFRVFPRGIWVTSEEMEDFRGYFDHIERSSRCDKAEKTNKAKSIIPD